ncbi:hypothetical protein GCM10008955_09600 [Deinococcus malanensis]|uniref:Tetratricopeptide repeat protein n=1 Tax=Deinococcus malanensis TaxID=1706855 RepID=A0ABQ2ENJ6_9DEIO|nr:hypothetical protein GCM10008955_09600 [Deinococcus malanensis]
MQAALREAEAMVRVDLAHGHRLFRDAIQLARAMGDRHSEALGLCLRGNTCFFTSRYLEARRWFTRALDTGQAIGDVRVQVRALNGLGITSKVQGDCGGAMEFFLTSLRLAQEHGDEAGRGRVLGNIGVLHAEVGKYDLALEAHLEVMAVGQRLALHQIHSTGTVNVVVDYAHLGEHDRATELAADYLPLLRERGFLHHEVVMQTHVVLCLVESGRSAEAPGLARTTLVLAEEVQDHGYISMLHLLLGRALHELGDFDQACDHLKFALAGSREREHRALERMTLQHLSQAYASRHEWQAAYEAAEAGHRLERTLHAQDMDRRVRVLGARGKWSA